MNLDLFNKSFRDTGAVVSYTSTSLRNKALQAAEGSKVTALAFVWIQRHLTSKIRLQFPVVVCKDLELVTDGYAVMLISTVIQRY